MCGSALCVDVRVGKIDVPTSQRIAMCCSVLQCAAVSVLCVDVRVGKIDVPTSQRIAVCCSALQ